MDPNAPQQPNNYSADPPAYTSAPPSPWPQQPEDGGGIPLQNFASPDQEYQQPSFTPSNAPYDSQPAATQPIPEPPANPLPPAVPTPTPIPTPETLPTPPPATDPTPAAMPVRATTTGDHPMIVMQPGEHLVCHIKRHPYGIITSYISAALFILIMAAAAVFLVPRLTQNSNNGSHIEVAAYGFLALLAVGTAAVLSIASKVYWQNEWIITSDSITQVSQAGLFSRQSAQLSMGNLEDVTVDQNGLIQHMFNFGTLHVETAGERSKFVFQFCPKPTEYARQILEARESFMRHRQYEGE